jgi:hypothetical protein
MASTTTIRKAISLVFFCFSVGVFLTACSTKQPRENILTQNNKLDYITYQKSADAFPLAENGQLPTLVMCTDDYQGINRVLGYFKTDLKNVTGVETNIILGSIPAEKYIILAGTIGKSKLIDQLIKTNKINVDDVEGRWENSLIVVVDQPFDGVEKALVIVGSDKRGTMYGIFDVSRKMGVSPWNWWADVPVVKSEKLYVKNGRYNLGEPKVKYRGIFLNDEEPALGRWAVEKYGGFNHQFYEKVFELMLRLKANYIWPAMWWASFNADDPQNAVLAHEMGIVLGTSHHEPMDRAHAEWKAKEHKGPWNYETNADELKQFWREGIERIGDREVIVNMGMRGDGDEAMSEDTNIKLLEEIVVDQRVIIEEVTQKPASETPQMWALYKEVQDYYEHGMRVPDDVTLLLCDDNWGNIRKLPNPNDPPRSGGYGIYYHFDFVGGPRNYKWINVSPVPRIWEQMNLAYRHGVDRLWLVNVGDLKPMELPISFFLDFAWDPDQITVAELDNYTRIWAEEQFGAKLAKDAAYILDTYTKYNSRRTPEMLYSDTYSITDFREFEKVTADYIALANKAEAMYLKMDKELQPAFYQLVYQPAKACANLYELYYAHALNKLYAQQNRVATADMAQKVKDHFQIDADITEFFHTKLLDGKWNHMMAQPRIGYTSWQQPPHNIMPRVTEIQVGDKAAMGIAVEGSREAWPGASSEPELPKFDSFNQQQFYFEVFNKGKKSFKVDITTSADWIKVSKQSVKISDQERIEVSINWKNAADGSNNGFVIVESENGEKQQINVVASKYDKTIKPKGYLERNGYVSIDACKYTKAVDNDDVEWKVIPGMGRTGSSITTFPVTASYESIDSKSPSLNYDFFLLEKPANNTVKVVVYVASTLNFKGTEGLHFGVSLNDVEPQIVNIHEGTEVQDWKYPYWFNKAVSEKVMIKTVELPLADAGMHTLKFWMMDNAVVYQKIVIESASVPFSYLGPPESKLYK